MNIQLLKQTDAILGRCAAFILPASGRPAAMSNPGTILVIRPGGIGDAALLAPALALLRSRFPAARIIVLAEKRNAGVLPLIPSVDQVLRYDVPREFLELFQLKPDLVIDTEQYHRLSAVVARLTGASVRIGFATNERARLFHHPVPYSHEEYEAASFFRLLAPLGIPAKIQEGAPFLTIPEAARIRASQLLAPLGRRRIIVLFPGASIPERRWGAERFRQVAIHFFNQGDAIIVIGGKEDREVGAAIVHQTGGLNLTGSTTLAETAAILRSAGLLITGDSGILHLGVGLGVPTVSLFGPGIAKKWAPQGPNHIMLNLHLPCSPCTRFGYTQPCPINAACIQQITPETVIEAASTLSALS